MTAALDRLERAGYVRRVRGETDRRQVRVEVTLRALELTEANLRADPAPKGSISVAG
jgi:DNA-binding MarR family transcriptional regulator